MGTCTSTPKTSSSSGSLSGSLAGSRRSPKPRRLSPEEHELKMSVYHARELEVGEKIGSSRPDPIALPVLGVTGYTTVVKPTVG